MNLADFDILSPLSAGPDGARFAALEKSSGRGVEVRVLSAASADPARWKVILKRLRRVAMLDHPGSLSLLQLRPEHDPPYIITEPLPASLLDLPPTQFPWKEGQVRLALRSLAAVLREAHRLGLVHGRLGPAAILGDNPPSLRLDFTGLDLDPPHPDPRRRQLADACLAPEAGADSTPQATADLFSLGVVAGWLWRGKLLPVGWTGRSENLLPTPTQGLSLLLESLLAPDPYDRIGAQSLVFDLADESASRLPTDQTSDHENENVQSTRMMLSPLPESVRRIEQKGPKLRLGRFQLEELLGEGGLGKVYRAVDSADGSIAAIKVLHEHLAARPALVKRFHKEARLLREINNPFIVNLLEHNEDGGIHYLALEFIKGPSLHHLLKDPQLCPTGRLPEPIALAIVMDVARALADAHRRGIIHRDIKPQNIMVLGDSDLIARLQPPARDDPSPPLPGGAKLCDFGLARHVVESESLHLTQAGVPVGTPLYMSPEQALGRSVGAPTDVYAVGATLYHLLAGRPPFVSDTALSLSLMHAHEPPPNLNQFNSFVSEGVCRLIDRCLAKKPEARFADGAALLDELERLVRGDLSSIVLHPQLPKAGRRVKEYTWIWELRSTPEQLWPYVSNTERLNHAAGLSAVQFTSQAQDAPSSAGLLPALERYGSFRKAGITNTWREHPFEWIEGRRLGVLREYSQGVFQWLASTVTLEPLPQGGTRLTHHVRIEPRSFLGKIVCALEVGIRGRRSVEKVYKRIDAYLAGGLDVTSNFIGGIASPRSADNSRVEAFGTSRVPGDAPVPSRPSSQPLIDLSTHGAGPEISDPFEKPPALSRAQKRRLGELLDKLVANQTPPHVVQALEEFVQNASDQDLGRIRPLALAPRLEVDPDALIHACLVGAREGLFTLLWDIVCPLCRIPAGMVETLKQLKEHAHCEACQTDFPVDFASSVELIFRVHSSIRAVETRTYCIGGPSHSPHVVAQIRLMRGETFQLDLSLAEGAYRLRGPQLPQTIDLHVHPASVLSRLPLQVPDDFTTANPKEPYRMQTGR